MRYIIFGKDSCGYCQRAKSLLESNNLDYKTIDFEPEQESILSEIKKAHDWPTVPMIFCREGKDVKFIGG